MWKEFKKQEVDEETEENMEIDESDSPNTQKRKRGRPKLPWDKLSKKRRSNKWAEASKKFEEAQESLKTMLEEEGVEASVESFMRDSTGEKCATFGETEKPQKMSTEEW